MSLDRATARDRAAGALWGLAIGDAVGMPTQTLSRTEIAARYGEIREFHDGPADHPLAAGLQAGSVTDDTEQALLLARVLGADGVVDEPSWAEALVEWERSMRARGSLDLLGPSTRRALDAYAAGVPADQTGRDGVTNGAAMRVAPVGIAVAATPLVHLVDRVVRASRLTHNTSLGLAGAAAVAAAVSTCLATGEVTAACNAAVAAADLAARRGRWVAGGQVGARIAWAVGEVTGAPIDLALGFLERLVGTGLAANESVPTAFGLVSALRDEPWQAVCTAASLGGDCDTIAAITGAILGAAHGRAAFPTWAVETVRRVNHLPDLDDLATRLLDLRA